MPAKQCEAGFVFVGAAGILAVVDRSVFTGAFWAKLLKTN